MNEYKWDEPSLRLLEDGVAFGRSLADERASAVHLVFIRLGLDAPEAPLADAAQGGLETGATVEPAHSQWTSAPRPPCRSPAARSAQSRQPAAIERRTWSTRHRKQLKNKKRWEEEMRRRWEEKRSTSIEEEEKRREQQAFEEEEERREQQAFDASSQRQKSDERPGARVPRAAARAASQRHAEIWEMKRAQVGAQRHGGRRAPAHQFVPLHEHLAQFRELLKSKSRIRSRIGTRREREWTSARAALWIELSVQVHLRTRPSRARSSEAELPCRRSAAGSHLLTSRRSTVAPSPPASCIKVKWDSGWYSFIQQYVFRHTRWNFERSESSIKNLPE